MGFFTAIVRITSYGLGFITNPAVILPLATLGFVAVSFFGIPFVFAVAGIGLALSWLGYQKACENCNKMVNNVMRNYISFLQQFTGSIAKTIPYPSSIDKQNSKFDVINGNTKLKLTVNLLSDRLMKASDFINTLKNSVVAGLQGVSVSVVKPFADTDYIIPIGNVDFSSAELLRLTIVEDSTSGEEVKVDVAKVFFPVSYMIVSFKVADCEACALLGGKTANEIIDETADEQNLGFVRKILVWRVPNAQNYTIKDSYTVTVTNWVPSENDKITVVYSSKAVLDQLYRTCINSGQKDKALEAVCKAFDPSKICPYAVVHNPRVFIDILRNYGYANPEIIQIAKVVADSLPSNQSSLEVMFAELTPGVARINRYIEYIDPETNARKLVDLNKIDIETAGQITSKNIAILHSDVPFSISMQLSLRNNAGAGGGYFGNVGTAHIIVDPYGKITTLPQGAPGVIASYPKLVVKDAHNTINVVYLGWCSNHVALYDEEKKAITIHGPLANKVADAVKSLLEWYLNSQNAKVNCKLAVEVLKIARDNKCIERDNTGKYRITCDIVAGGLAGTNQTEQTQG